MTSIKRKAGSDQTVQTQHQPLKKVQTTPIDGGNVVQASLAEGITLPAPPAQNTFQGLPNELKAMIMSECVNYGSQIDTTDTFDHHYFGPDRHTRTDDLKADTLAPIRAIGNTELLQLAEQEFYRSNVFHAAVLVDDYESPSIATADLMQQRYLDDDHHERANIMHLDISILCEFRLRDEHPAKISDFGQPEASILRTLPMRYPKLRTLRIYLALDTYARERQRKGEDLVASEVSYVANILRALRIVKSEYRNTQVTFCVRHSSEPLVRAPGSSPREPTEIDGRRFVADAYHPAEIQGREFHADEDLAWQMLDLPEVVVEL